jgi:hypothetical protein
LAESTLEGVHRERPEEGGETEGTDLPAKEEKPEERVLGARAPEKGAVEVDDGQFLEVHRPVVLVG